VSDLVTGKQRYNRDVLNDVASALNITPYELLMHPGRRNGAAPDKEARRANGADSARRNSVDLDDDLSENRKAG
jgi:hypothetical protein